MSGALTLTGSLSLLDELLASSEHIAYRLDFVRGGYDFISPRAANLLGIALADLHARGWELLDEHWVGDDRERCFAELVSLCAAAPGRSCQRVSNTACAMRPAT